MEVKCLRSINADNGCIFRYTCSRTGSSSQAALLTHLRSLGKDHISGKRRGSHSSIMRSRYDLPSTGTQQRSEELWEYWIST